ncbi:MAG: lysylphosphatidylglycerol synthase transmembrane domain-containing protein, partial [Thermodesulfobacteriota bacterium]|nr:lysylphosphatidylglycerol synthase transmembrane domain-containing protein [Thermodesulfobacteriota bacterium]
MKKNITISLCSGILLSAAAFYLSFRKVPLAELATYLTTINYFWILPSVFIALISFVIRTIRWQVILGAAHTISFWQAFHPLMIAFMLNCILPGRIGELTRPAILHKKDNIPFSTGLATVAAERLFDIILLILLSITVFAFVHIDPALDISFGKYHLNRKILIAIGAGMLKLGAALITGIIIINFSAVRKIVKRLIMALPAVFFFMSSDFKNRVQERICTPLTNFLENFALGFVMIKNPKKVGICIVLSIIIWSLAALSYYVIALGCPGIRLSYFEIMAVMIIICLFIALPSVPGYWGLWEAGGVFALSLFGISAKQALGFTLANHVIQIIPVIIIGLVSAMTIGVNILKNITPPQAKQP